MSWQTVRPKSSLERFRQDPRTLRQMEGIMASDKDKVQMRPMLETDLASVYAVDRLLFARERTPTWPFTFESYYLVYHPEIRFVAEIGEDIVGFIVGNVVEEEHNQSVTSLRHTMADFDRHRWIAWIDMIGIDPSHQGKGIGRGLVDAFHDECRSRNAVMRAVSRDADDRLKSFLEAMGFKRWDIVYYEKE